MNREQAVQIVTALLTNQNIINHCLATEATMKALAKYFGENEEKWGITGLLHDVDYEESREHPEKHGLLLFEKEYSIPEDIVYAIKSHNYEYTHVMPKSHLDWAITCCDGLTLLTIAAVLDHPSKKLANIHQDFLIKRMQKKDFVQSTDKKHIYLCEEKLGIPLIQFVTIALSAMQGISNELGL
jgi:putative nucleotidyltransferase with HDIG domain